MIFSSLRDLLAEQWTRLSTLEQMVLTWLAIVREPLGAAELHDLLVIPVAEEQVREALEALHRRSLVERGKQLATFTLQSVVLEYVTEVLVERVSQQIQHGVWKDLISYALELAGAKEYVRQAQERLIVAPILVRLQALSPQTDALEERLLCLLNQLRVWDQEVQGYGPANLIALLRLRRGHLRGLDLSQLALREASLQGVQMQDAKLCGATLQNTLLTEAMHAIWSVAISRTGTFWAAGSQQGEVRVWREGGQRLHLVWQGHTNTPLASPLARMNARWPPEVGMVPSNCGMWPVARSSGRVGILTSSTVWSSLLMGTRLPAAGWMPPSGFGRCPRASRDRRW